MVYFALKTKKKVSFSFFRIETFSFFLSLSSRSMFFKIYVNLLRFDSFHQTVDWHTSIFV